jgi:two-component system response regulator DevR
MTQPDLCRVLIVEDHSIVRQCLAMLMARHSDVVVVGETETAAEALAQVGQLQPDLVITDIALPDDTGINLSREIRSRYPQTRVLILTSRGDDRAIIGTIVGGASGFLLKEFQSQPVLEAVRKAHRGVSLLDPSIARRVLDRVLSEVGEDAESRLTTEEQQILELVSQGRNNREIAQMASLTETTVKTRVNTIYGKLEISRKIQSVSYSIQWRESRRTG